jgi:hypothetical protein
MAKNTFANGGLVNGLELKFNGMILNPLLPVISLRYEQAMEEKEKHNDMVQQRIKKFNANGQDLYEMILYT